MLWITKGSLNRIETLFENQSNWKFSTENTISSLFFNTSWDDFELLIDEPFFFVSVEAHHINKCYGTKHNKVQAIMRFYFFSKKNAFWLIFRLKLKKKKCMIIIFLLSFDVSVDSKIIISNYFMKIISIVVLSSVVSSGICFLIAIRVFFIYENLMLKAINNVQKKTSCTSAVDGCSENTTDGMMKMSRMKAIEWQTSISGIPCAKYGRKWCSEPFRQSSNFGSDRRHWIIYSAAMKK